MEELDVIQELGIVTSKEVMEHTKKCWISTIRQLENLRKHDLIVVVETSWIRGKRKIYIEKSIYEEIEDEIC